MNIQVKEVGEVQTKSVQEKEQEYAEEYEKKLEGADNEEVEEAKVDTTEEEPEVIEEQTEEEAPQFKEEDVLSFIKTKYPDREIQSIDDLLAEPKETKLEVPEDVAAYLEYKEKTGRGLRDYLELNKDYKSMDPDSLLFEWKKSTEKGLDAEDIKDMVDEEYSYDEELDDEIDVKRKKRAKKKAVAQALEYFEEQKKMFKEPLESSSATGTSEDVQKKLQEYQQYIDQSSDAEKQEAKRREWYLKNTEELFSEKFEGFKFDLDGKKVSFAPAKAEELKRAQTDTSKFFAKFVDDQGLLKDPEGWHRALAVAMNPDKFAKFFYEQGKSEGTEDVTKTMKNVDMDSRSRPETTSKGGMKVAAVNPSGGNRLVIRSKKT